jgi:hypothetical protein
MAWVEQTGQRSWRVRYRCADGTVGSVPGFSSRRSAEAYAGDLESGQRRQVWLDPAGGRLELRSWVARWLPVQDLDPRTADNYESYLRCHVLVRFGATPLGGDHGVGCGCVGEGVAGGRHASATVASWVKLLSMILSDAVRQRLISANPVRQRRRRGRRSRAMVAGGHVEAECGWLVLGHGEGRSDRVAAHARYQPDGGAPSCSLKISRDCALL